MKRPVLFLVWLVALEGIGYYLSSTFGLKGVNVAMAFYALIWCGFTLAISFTEAWIKFQAKLLEKHVALDVGRNIFDALNSVELALCLSMITLKALHTDAIEIPPQVVFVWICLASQLVFITSALESRAIHFGNLALANKKYPSKVEEEVYKEFKAHVTLHPMPPKFLHFVYVLMEVFKVLVLTSFALALLLQ